MEYLTKIRQPKLMNIVVFDTFITLLSIIGIWFLVGNRIPLAQLLLSSFHIIIITHITFGQDTPLSRNFTDNGHVCLKIFVFITTLFTLFYPVVRRLYHKKAKKRNGRWLF